MRNPGFFRNALRIFGKSPVMLPVDVRAITAGVEAARILQARPKCDPEMARLLDGIGTTQEALDLVRASLAKNEAWTRRAAERVTTMLRELTKRPVEDIAGFLGLYVSAVHELKDREMREMEELASRYAWKDALAAGKDSERRMLLSHAAGRGRALRLGADALEQEYDRAHGAYATIDFFIVVPRRSCGLEALTAAVREGLHANGYVPVADDGRADPSRVRISISEVGRLYLCTSTFPSPLDEICKIASPVLVFDSPMAFDREGWTYMLIADNAELDRHCGTPFSLASVTAMMNDRNDPRLIKRVITAWSGDPDRLAAAFGVSREAVSPYLHQFHPEVLQRIWDERRLFVSFKAFEDDAFSLVSPWVHRDLLCRLGGGPAVRGAFESRMTLCFGEEGP